jgi:hypothetical protein
VHGAPLQNDFTGNPGQMPPPMQQDDPALLVAMLFKSIEDRDMNLFVQNFNRLNHFQVHQLIGCVEGHGLTLIHQCAYFGQF